MEHRLGCVNIDLHVDFAQALAVGATKSIIVHTLKIQCETHAARRKLAELALAESVWAAALDGEFGRTLTAEVHAFVIEPAAVPTMAMCCQASEIFNCWLAATLPGNVFVEAIVASICIVEMASLTALVYM